MTPLGIGKSVKFVIFCDDFHYEKILFGNQKLSYKGLAILSGVISSGEPCTAHRKNCSHPLHSPSVREDDVAVPDLLAGRDGDLLAGERDAVHEVVDAAAQLLLRLVVAHAGKTHGVDPVERWEICNFHEKHFRERTLNFIQS